MKQLCFITLCVLFLASCDHHKRPEKKDASADTLSSVDAAAVKNEILLIDKELTDYADSNGLKESFNKYLSSDAVFLKTNHLPIDSKDSILAFIGKKKIKDLKFTRIPTFTDVSQSGDLAYLYGTYEISGTNSNGKNASSKGSYVSVWKKNKTGVWELVLESENEGLVPVKKQIK
jgi:ketosteroid isomerase-like protein